MTLHAFFAASVLLLACGLRAAETDWRPLFNGRDLSGWERYLGVPFPASVVPGAEKGADGKYTKVLGLENDPLGCFSVVEADGAPAIRLSGEGFGTLTTRESFSNYHLRLQFKWGVKKFLPGGESKPRGSGLLYHAHGNHGDADSQKRWLHAQQFQIQEGSTGDYIAVGDTSAQVAAREAGPGKWVYAPGAAVAVFSAQAANKGKCLKGDDAEKAGEWNTIELVCVGASAVHVVNGREVLRISASAAGAAGEPLGGGRLQLQMEGAEVYFRAIEICPAKELPAAP